MRRRVQQDQVGPGAHAEMADVGPAQRPGAARGGGPDRLLGGHPHVADGQRDAERHAGRERGTRVAVGGQGHRGARVEQPARVGERLPGAELRAGQQGRHQRREDSVSRSAPVRKVQWSAEAARASAATRTPGPGPSWLAWTRVPARGPARGEHRGGLVRAERPFLAEHVDPPGVRRARVEHRAAHQVHVAGHVPGELGRHHVRAEVGDLGRDLGGERQPARLVRRR